VNPCPSIIKGYAKDCQGQEEFFWEKEFFLDQNEEKWSPSNAGGSKNKSDPTRT
jgi:hypothetical protein